MLLVEFQHSPTRYLIVHVSLPSYILSIVHMFAKILANCVPRCAP
jgi:hypothetical protein